MLQDHEKWNQDRVALDAWREKPLEEVIRFVMERFHRETRLGMAELEGLAEEAALWEGHHFPELLAIRDEVDLFCREMRDHLRMEETALFPSILAKLQGREVEVDHELIEPIDLYADEHDAAEGLLKRIRQLTQGFNPPAGARELQTELYAACKRLSESLIRHIYVENQILFKRIPEA